MSQDNFDKDIHDAQDANQDTTYQPEQTEQTDQEAAPETVDYKVKFTESSREALRLLEESREKDRIIAELQASNERGDSHAQTMENLYPGFEQLDAEAQANLIAFSEGITKKVRDEFSQDPAIAYSRKNYNESVWDKAFQNVLIQYPELVDSKEEFKSKYFNANNVPSNVEEILGDVAKIHLFDKARNIGAEDEKNRQKRADVERATGGDRNISTSRTLDDWYKLSQENPAKFAEMSKEYNSDLEAGRLK